MNINHFVGEITVHWILPDQCEAIHPEAKQNTRYKSTLNMKQISSLLLMTLFFTIASAQNNDTMPIKPSNYIIDGTNPQFVWGNANGLNVNVGISNDQETYLLDGGKIMKYKTQTQEKIAICDIHEQADKVYFLKPTPITFALAQKLPESNFLVPVDLSPKSRTVPKVNPISTNDAALDTIAVYNKITKQIKVSGSEYLLQTDKGMIILNQQKTPLIKAGDMDVHLFIFFFANNYLSHNWVTK